MGRSATRDFRRGYGATPRYVRVISSIDGGERMAFSGTDLGFKGEGLVIGYMTNFDIQK